jgi:hypothetical protein
MLSNWKKYVGRTIFALLFIPVMSYGQDSSDTTGTGSVDITLPEPSNYAKEIIYDPTTGNYLVYKKIGDIRLPIPEVWTVDQYRQYMYNRAEEDYMA